MKCQLEVELLECVLLKLESSTVLVESVCDRAVEASTVLGVQRQADMME